MADSPDTPLHDEHAEGHAHGHDDHGGTGKYLMVFGGLVVLTAISFWIGNSTIKETAPRVAWAAMMAVSCGKALLVMLFFMHLLWEANWKYVLTIPASMMSVFLALMLVPDIGLRTLWYSEPRELHAAEPDPQRFERERQGHAEPGHAAEDGH